MGIYTLQTPDGKTIKVEGPDNATDDEIIAFAKAQTSQNYNVEIDRPAPVPATPAAPAPIDRGGLVAGVDAVRRGFTSGATANTDDEAAAALGTVVPGGAASVWDGSSIGEAFDKNLDYERSVDHADEEQNPWLRTGGQIVGGIASAAKLASPLGAAGAAVAGTKLGALLGRAAATRLGQSMAVRGAAGGGLAGLLSGFGAGEGSLEARSDSAADAGKGGAIFGAAGAAAVGTLGPVIGRYWNAFRNSGTVQEATAQIVRALGRDGYDVTSPAGVQALRTELARFTGKPVSLADVGRATRSRAGVALRSPSEAQQRGVDAVYARSAGQGDRLAADVRATVAPRTDVHALDDALVQQRSEQALPLRDAALFEAAPALPPPRRGAVVPVEDDELAGVLRTLGQEPPTRYAPTTVPTGEASELGRASRIIDDPQLQQLARLPDAQKALKAAVARAESERGLKSVLGQSIDDIPDIRAGSQLDMRTLDYLKRYLDDEVKALAQRGQGQTFSAGQYAQVRDLRNAIRNRMREAVPEYGDYLDSYAGSSEMIDALEAGRKYRQPDPEAVAAEQGERSTAAQELYRVGAARDLIDTLRSTKDGRNPATRILESDSARDSLAATGVAPDNLRRLQNAVEQERQLNQLPAELSGSATDARRIAGQDADAGVAASAPFNPGSAIGWLGFVARKAAEKASLQRNEGINAALLPRLLETDPAIINRIISELEQGGQAAQAAQLRRALAARRTATGIGIAIGGPLATREGN